MVLLYVLLTQKSQCQELVFLSSLPPLPPSLLPSILPHFKRLLSGIKYQSPVTANREWKAGRRKEGREGGSMTGKERGKERGREMVLFPLLFHFPFPHFCPLSSDSQINFSHITSCFRLCFHSRLCLHHRMAFSLRSVSVSLLFS